MASTGNNPPGGTTLPRGVIAAGWVLVAFSAWTTLIGLLAALVGLTIPVESDDFDWAGPLAWVFRYPSLAGLVQVSAGGIGLVVGVGVLRSRPWAVSGLRLVLIGLLVAVMPLSVAIAVFFIGLLDEPNFPLALGILGTVMGTVMTGLIILGVRAGWKYLDRTVA